MADPGGQPGDIVALTEADIADPERRSPPSWTYSSTIADIEEYIRTHPINQYNSIPIDDFNHLDCYLVLNNGLVRTGDWPKEFSVDQLIKITDKGWEGYRELPKGWDGAFLAAERKIFLAMNTNPLSASRIIKDIIIYGRFPAVVNTFGHESIHSLVYDVREIYAQKKGIPIAEVNVDRTLNEAFAFFFFNAGNNISLLPDGLARLVMESSEGSSAYDFSESELKEKLRFIERLAALGYDYNQIAYIIIDIGDDWDNGKYRVERDILTTRLDHINDRRVEKGLEVLNIGTSVELYRAQRRKDNLDMRLAFERAVIERSNSKHEPRVNNQD